MIHKITQLKKWQAVLLIIIVGFAVFTTGLANPFAGDDDDQIVNNIPVHSITNIQQFFEGGTFYTGQQANPLTGSYRPLMTVCFSVLYSIFGPQPFYFHLFQITLHILCAIMLFLFLLYSFKPSLSLFLSLIFLVHPINSQAVLAIASLQDVLFLLFGITGLWLLAKFKSVKSLFLVVLCLFLALLSKETGIVFVVLAALSLLLFDRYRLYKFLAIAALPVACYILLRTQAVGTIPGGYHAPIAGLELSERLLMVPSIICFYIVKFIAPIDLASAYYWVYSSISVRHFVIPTLIVAAIAAAIFYIGIKLRRSSSREVYYTYLFFAAWTVIGILPHMQLIPLDMTASETWFYAPIIGLLGIIGVCIQVYAPYKKYAATLLVAGVLIVGCLGVRTAARGLDWRSAFTLATKNIASSREDFTAYNQLANYYIEKHNYELAADYAQKSVSIFPNITNNNNLGYALANQGQYQKAAEAYYNGLKYGDYNVIYDNIASLTLVFGDSAVNRQYLLQSLEKFPDDSTLWLCLAILEAKQGNDKAARDAVSQANSYNPVSSVVYDGIMKDQPFSLYITNLGRTIDVP